MIPARIRDALDQLGLVALEIVPVTNPDPFLTTHRTFRITFAAGPVLKARIAYGLADAVRAESLAAALGDPRVPAPVHRVGRVTFERWVDGAPLDEIRATEPELGGTGGLLAAVHGFAGGRREGLPQLRRTDYVRARTFREAEWLHTENVLTRAEAAAAASLVETLFPSRALWGLTHGDLAAANLVREADGRVVSIDHERLRRGFLDWDLARSWYRWPLAPADQRAFETGYALASGRRPDPREQLAWRLVASIRGVVFRRRFSARAEHRIERLRQALTEAGEAVGGS